MYNDYDEIYYIFFFVVQVLYFIFLEINMSSFFVHVFFFYLLNNTCYKKLIAEAYFAILTLYFWSFLEVLYLLYLLYLPRTLGTLMIKLFNYSGYIISFYGKALQHC